MFCDRIALVCVHMIGSSFDGIKKKEQI